VDRLGASFLVCVSCLIAPFGGYAQRLATVAGYVYCEEKSHTPKNVQVELRGSDQAQLASVPTGDDGAFRFDGD
jgi:hypothetical protein